MAQEKNTKEKNKLLRVLYNTTGGRIVLKTFVNPGTSELVGRFLSTRFSKIFINSFIRKNQIDTHRYEQRTYQSYNDYFTRKLIREPDFSTNSFDLCSPCDSYLSAYDITDESIFNIKDTDYSVSDLLFSKSLAEKYIGGICLIFRLAVSNFHRYCYFDSGKNLSSRVIDGNLHTVRPIAFERFNVFKHNSREYTIMETENFSQVIQIEVGAMFVGKIVNHPGITKFIRGQEKGYFEFGGSTIVLLLPPQKAIIDPSIVKNTLEGKETPVTIGQIIGHSLKGSQT